MSKTITGSRYLYAGKQEEARTGEIVEEGIRSPLEQQRSG